MDAGSRPRDGDPPHWPGGDLANFGNQISTLHSIMIHGTGGWPSYESANNMVNQYTCQVAENQGIGPSYCIDCNGTAFQLLDIDPARVTLHGGYMNGVSLGIENTDAGDSSAVRPQPTNQTYWRKLTNLPDTSDDLQGMILRAVLHPNGGNEGGDFIPLWFPTSRYTGPGDLDHASGFYTLFTDADYRTLTLLCRFLAEHFRIPRNFTLLPYQDRHSNANDVATLRRLVMADERFDVMVRMFGRTAQEFVSHPASLDTWYQGRRSTITRQGAHGPFQETINGAWTDFFADPHATGAKRGFRGFVSHVISGSISHDNDHTCPGPYFDWHRFAREVWDWWWYPFDFEATIETPPFPSVTARPYRQARKDTPLLEYYFDAPASDPNFENLRTPAAAATSADSDEFSISTPTPIYALSNGVAVAARIPNEAVEPGQMGFLLSRHEVFHRTEVIDHPGSDFDPVNIDYDRAPSYVYSLVTHLKHASINYSNLSSDNPEWLNRLIKHLFQCNSAVEFRRDHPADAFARRAWGHDPVPSNRVHRWAVGAQIQRDLAAYQALVDDLSLVRPVCFPIENSLGATTVRVVLGDFLGIPGRPGTPGIGFSIFSRDELPVAGRVRSQLGWSTSDWWQAAAAATRFEDDPGKPLPADGVLWRYPMLPFLKWINDVTWASEWPKYRVTNASGNPVSRPAKPRPRRGL
jgi:hypothetical protein